MSYATVVDELTEAREDYLKRFKKLERKFSWPDARALRLLALAINKKHGHLCQETGERLPIDLEPLIQLEMKQS